MLRFVLFLLLLLAVTVSAETFTTPEGYFPQWVTLDSSGYVTSRRGNSPPFEIDSSSTPQGIWHWVIVNEAEMVPLELGSEGNWRLTTSTIDVGGVTQTEIVTNPSWSDADVQTELMVGYYLQAYQWDVIRQAAVDDDTLPAGAEAAVVAEATARRDAAKSLADAIKDELYP